MNGFFEVVGALPSDAFQVDSCQVILDTCPLFGEGVAGINLQSLLIVVDRLLEIVGALAADAVEESIR